MWNLLSIWSWDVEWRSIPVIFLKAILQNWADPRTISAMLPNYFYLIINWTLWWIYQNIPNESVEKRRENKLTNYHEWYTAHLNEFALFLIWPILFTTQLIQLMLLVMITVFAAKILKLGFGRSIYLFIEQINLDREAIAEWRRRWKLCWSIVWPSMSFLMAYVLLSVTLVVYGVSGETFPGANWFIHGIVIVWQRVGPRSNWKEYVKGILELAGNCTMVLGGIFYAKNYLRCLLKHAYSEHEEENVMGWNIFQHHGDGTVTFTMPTEETHSLASVLKDEWLLHKVMGVTEEESPPGYPDFMIILPRREDTENFVRHMTNHVSRRVAISQWPQHALAHRENQENPYEKPLMLVACEKNPGVRNRCTRTWLIFPSELHWLLQFTEDEINDPNGIFIVEKDHWRIRILNLWKWAKLEFETDRDLHCRVEIILPQS